MSLILYHRTTIGDARSIAKHGFQDREWDFGLRDARSGEEVTVAGIWLADRRVGQDEGLDGDALLEVRLDVDVDEIASFELEGMLWDGRFWIVPAEWLTAHATVRIGEVDPSTSGFFDAATGDPEF